ncbi:ATP-binding protein [Candidatus Shapirobacteria bacterium]|nr:ATP-binding protein [Candidatus Shapirobacteria bacterium]
MEIQLDLLKYNQHWQEGFTYPYPKKRKLFGNLVSFLNKRQILEITGLRRVGKTVLLFQLINHLLQKGSDRFRLWYFTFDEQAPSLDDLLAAFSRQTEVDYRKEKVFLFLDEIQKLPNFQNQVKVCYDLYPNIKFFLSGSCSLFLKKKRQESLAGRIFSFFLPPPDFEEYLFFKEKSQILSRPLLFQSEIEKEFEIFLRSQFIESINFAKPGEKKEYFISIIKKIIFEDIPGVFPVDSPPTLWQIAKILAQHPGMLVNYQNLASDLGVSNKTISLYLYYLEEAFLVRKIYNFSRNLLTSEKKLKKYYLASPSFSSSLADFSETALLAENLVAAYKNINFFWRDIYKNEVDFIRVEDNSITPIEVKYKDEVEAAELKNLFRFLEKTKTSRGLVFSKELKERQVAKGGLKIFLKPIYLSS